MNGIIHVQSIPLPSVVQTRSVLECPASLRAQKRTQKHFSPPLFEGVRIIGPLHV